MYSLIGIGEEAVKIIDYVMTAMRKEGFTEREIHKYIDEARVATEEYLVELSNKILDDCNERKLPVE